MGDFKVKGRIFEVAENDIKELMKEFELTRSDAVRMYFEEMELVATGGKDEIVEIAETKPKRHYNKSDKPRKKSTRERKVDTEKLELIKAVAPVIAEYADNEIIIKNEVEIKFNYNDNEYTFKLIKHRQKKV